MNLALEKYQYIEGYERATLPERYKTAKKAIASCVNMDILKEIRDKTAALKTYARMSMDDELYLMAMKVQNQAKVRMGDLIREVEKASGGDQSKISQKDISRNGRGAAADAAGLKTKQAIEAVAMSRVPEKKREKLIESGATSAEIAAEGRKYTDEGRVKKKHCVHCGETFAATQAHDCLPEGFHEATTLLGHIRRMTAFTSQTSPAKVARGIRKNELQEAKDNLQPCLQWLKDFDKQLRRRK